MFQIWTVLFWYLFRYRVIPHFKVLDSSKYELRELSCGCNFDTCQGILKIENLLYEQSLDETQLLRTVFVYELDSCLHVFTSKNVFLKLVCKKGNMDFKRILLEKIACMHSSTQNWWKQNVTNSFHFIRGFDIKLFCNC